MLKQNLSILRVKLRKSMEILKRPLSHKIVRISDERHQYLQHGLECYLIVIVDHQILEETTWSPIEKPFEAACVKVFQFKSVLIDTFSKDHVARTAIFVMPLIFACEYLILLVTRRLIEQKSFNATAVHCFLFLVTFSVCFWMRIIERLSI